MAKTREIITAGLAERMKKTESEAQIKVRQPLAKLVYAGEELDDFYEQIIMEEVNVKSVEHGESLALDKTLTPELLEEGKIRELIRFVQAARKKAGLNVDDRIRLMVSMEVPEVYRKMLMNEVLAEELVHEGNFAYDEIVKVQGENVAISLEKIWAREGRSVLHRKHVDIGLYDKWFGRKLRRKIRSFLMKLPLLKHKQYWQK